MVDIAHQSGAGLQASYSVLFSLATLAVALRLIARSTRGHKPYWDDGVLLLAWFLSLGIFTAATLGTQNGWGLHTYQVSPAQLRYCQQLTYVCVILWNPLTLITRLAILVLYHRIIPSINFRRCVYAMMVYCIATSIAVWIPSLLVCRPIRLFWDKSVPGHCHPAMPALTANFVVNLVADIIILIMPVPIFFRLHIHWKRKVGLILIFALGIFTCITAAIRFPYIHTLQTSDPLYDSTYAGLWTYAEANCGIICACLPALPTLFQGRPSRERKGSPASDMDWPSLTRDSSTRRRNQDVEDLLPTPAAHTTTFDDVVLDGPDGGAARNGTAMSDVNIKVETDIRVTECSRSSPK
ncbi:MAG: hypothetical protein M1823_002020 [Watsoniomyces obsoletus]|nr:MAG: hypothetical protein M1823_002020 [Watsoniomyces obsoletus]